MTDIVIDHLGFMVSDYPRSKAFYAAALAPLGMSVMMEFPIDDGAMLCGFGKEKPIFWLTSGALTAPHVHLAFGVPSRAEVDAFYAAAMAAGATDNGGPGIRTDYHPNYYAAYVLDLDGHNIEAVCHQPE